MAQPVACIQQRRHRLQRLQELPGRCLEAPVRHHGVGACRVGPCPAKGGCYWLRVKYGNPKMACPSKWKHGLKPAVVWWFNFDPYPLGQGICEENERAVERYLEDHFSLGLGGEPQSGAMLVRERATLSIRLNLTWVWFLSLRVPFGSF